uniref:Uncharacterized protein n=1 Tax=Junco hyemalis TaxID=40217 RepID=A0A8C5NMG4_JUNHY
MFFLPVLHGGVGKCIPWDCLGWTAVKEVGKDRNLDFVSQWVQISVYLGICLFVCLGFFYLVFLNFDRLGEEIECTISKYAEQVGWLCSTGG